MVRCLTGGASPLTLPSPEETVAVVEAVAHVATVGAAVVGVTVEAVIVATVATAVVVAATAEVAVVVTVVVVMVAVADLAMVVVVVQTVVAGGDRQYVAALAFYFCLQVVLCFATVIILLVVELYAGNCPWAWCFDVL